MKVLFVSAKGELLPVAERFDWRGHDVRLYTKEVKYKKRGIGIVDPGKPSDDADLIIGDVGMGAIKGTWGVNEWSDAVCEHKEYATQLLGRDENVSGLWDGEKFTCFYHKRDLRGFMAEGVGPDIVVGCVVKIVEAPDVAECEDVLRKTSYRGPVHMGTEPKAGATIHELVALDAITPKGIVGLVMDEDVPREDFYGVSVLVSVPPYPYMLGCEEAPFTLQEGAARHFWGVDCKRGGTAGIDGLVGYAAARGKSTGECSGRIERTVRNIPLEELQYRLDCSFIEHS